MKQVDADGLEIITVNGGELKAPQGGGVDSGGRPSIGSCGTADST
jgi:hypothetical protein